MLQNQNVTNTKYSKTQRMHTSLFVLPKVNGSKTFYVNLMALQKGNVKLHLQLKQFNFETFSIQNMMDLI